jgi:hypothetical protein
MFEQSKPTPVERRMVGLLRERVERAIEYHGRDWAAGRLDVSEPGIEAVLWDRTWTVGTAVHIAGCLEVLTHADLDTLEKNSAVA